MLLYPFPAPAQQLLQGIAGNLTATLVDSTGEPKSGLTVAVTVTRADGTALLTNSAVTDNANGTYSVALTAAQLATLDYLTAAWTVAAVVQQTTGHEVVGGFYFNSQDVLNVEQGRASNDGQDLASLRYETEAECERICRKSFVPRYNRLQLDATARPWLILPHPYVRTIRSVRVYATSTTYSSFTNAELAAITIEPTGLIERADFGVFGYWPSGSYTTAQKLVIEYEHGDDRPPADLKRATIRRYRQRANKSSSSANDRAISFTAENGATYRIATASEYATGDPDIDAVYDRYAFKAGRYGVLA